jgi:hypothetical protein
MMAISRKIFYLNWFLFHTLEILLHKKKKKRKFKISLEMF